MEPNQVSELKRIMQENAAFSDNINDTGVPPAVR